ncbi:MAG: hypothetical protein WC100_16900 [Sterolibacterium sp.]
MASARRQFLFASLSDTLRQDRERTALVQADDTPIEPDTEDRIDIEGLAFQRWFQGSQMVDESGNPQLFYHGTSADFVEFDHAVAAQTRPAFGNAFFFSPTYASALKYGRNIMVCCLRITAPLILAGGENNEARFGRGTPYDGAIFVHDDPDHNEFMVAKESQIKLIRRERAGYWE